MEAIRHFSDREVCLTFVAELRWPNGVQCPKCQHKETSFLKTRRIWKCKGCKKQFSAKVGTIFESSPIPLDKWLTAMWMLTNCKNGISSYEVHRALGVTQKTAWFMLHRIRLAMQDGNFEKLSGEVEADETFVGGLSKNMHKSRRAKAIHGTGGVGKTVAMGILQRKGKIKTMVVPNVQRETLHAEIRKHVEPGSELFTDAWKAYRGLAPEYLHQIIDHAVSYVEGKVHTNGIENFWTLLKRALKGTYTHCDPCHLFRYLDEQSFRFNERQRNDARRFVGVLGQIAGKRLKYDELTGKGLAVAAV